jgi:hypothetical protein
VYQVKATGGWEIQVIGGGEKDLCRVADRHQQTHYTGTYAECEGWLRARGVEVTYGRGECHDTRRP